MAKICMVSPSLKMGGIERALTTLAGHFAERGHSVIFISCLRGSHFYQLDPRVQLVEPLDEHRSDIIGKILFYWKLCKFIRRSVLAARPDVVLSFGDSFNPLVIMSLVGSGLPVFISDRISPMQKLPVYVKILKGCFYRQASGIIAQTKRAAEHKYKQFGKRINLVIIPNAIRHIVPYETVRENIVLYVGRLSYEKGADRLIEALAMLGERSGWRYIFAGEGPQKERLQQMVYQKQLKNVEFVGNIQQIDDLFMRSKIFVIPSRTEGFPNSLAEAMANGCASVSFDSIPSGDVLVDGEEGIIVKDGDINALSDAIDTLMNNESYRAQLAENARKASSKFGLEIIGDQYLEFILPK